MKNDFCTRDGALLLQDRIRKYWKERGFEVNVDLVEAGFVPAMRSARIDVRSDMVNGIPVRRMNGSAQSGSPQITETGPQGQAGAADQSAQPQS